MSSPYNSSSTVDAQAHTSSEHIDDLRLNNIHPFNSSLDQSYLSPYHSHTISNTTSPYNIDSTPGESISDYSNYQPSEFSDIEDPFFGVDFGRIDSFPTAISGNVAFPSVPTSGNPQFSGEEVNSQTTRDDLTASTYPLSPRYTSIPNTPSPRSVTNDLKTKTTLSQLELKTELHNSSFLAFSSLNSTHPAALQLTPNHSGSSHTTSEELNVMTYSEHSPHPIIPHLNEHSQPYHSAFPQSSEQDDSATNSETLEKTYSTMTQIPQSSEIEENEDEEVQRPGLAPDHRKDVEIPSLKQQEEQRRIDARNDEVEDWRSHAGEKSDEVRSGEVYLDPGEARSSQPEDPAEVHNDIPPVDDAASIRENTLQEGQYYYNLQSIPKPEVDKQVMSRPRHWHDPPTLPLMTITNFQPPTSNEAIRKWNLNADSLSITSRAATWGTQRRRASEPSLIDYEAVADGSFLKGLSVKPKEGERRQSNFIDQGLDRIANMVRKRSDAKLKRARSSQNISQETQDVRHPRNNSQGSLAPPPRTSSFGRRPTPSLNTAIGAMTGSIGAIGNPHARSGSVSGAPTSPKSPSHLGFSNSARSVINRVRSRSDLASREGAVQPGLAQMWKGQGGPPVASLAVSPPLDADERIATFRKPKAKSHALHEVQDHDDDDDDDDEGADDGDLKIEPDRHSDPIIPNYNGFKAHVRRLNPDIEGRYNWLVSRIAHQQEIRYKQLLDLRVKHLQSITNKQCSAERHCVALGGKATLLDIKGNTRDPEPSVVGLYLQTDFSDDSNPGEGALTDETFPQGVPMPSTRNLPAEFECQLCFKSKKFQKPSDWTKHVHEDVQPFTCTYESCKDSKSFKRKADWVRHENERHRRLEWWVCQIDDCTHTCYRKDNFLQHLVREHKLPEPKQKTKAAIKKARGTEPVWMMLDKCHHETRNKPEDEICKFCGKSFTTWKKLTVHLAKHMEYISLPILRLVELRDVDASTIISPIEQIRTPITPTGHAKLESVSPLTMDNISLHVPHNQDFSSGFDQSNFYTASGSARYGIQQEAPRDVAYNQNSMYLNNFDAHPIAEPRSGFVDMSHSAGVNNLNPARHFESVNAGFAQRRVEQTHQFSSMDSAFSHTIPGYNYNPQQTSGFMMPNYASAPPATSGYQASNLLSISQSGFDVNTMAGNRGQSLQQVPISRAPGSTASYDYSRQNLPNSYPHQP